MSDPVKVVLETFRTGRITVSELDADGCGHGYRLHGAKFMDDVIPDPDGGEPLLPNETPALTHEFDTGDAMEIRLYMQAVDRLNDPGWDPSVMVLTDALERWKTHTQGVVNRHREREPQAREALVAALWAAIDTIGGERGGMAK